MKKTHTNIFSRRKIIAAFVLMVLMLPMMGYAADGVDKNPRTIENLPGTGGTPLVAPVHALGLSTIIHNTAATTAQLNDTEARNETRHQEVTELLTSLFEGLQASINKDFREWEQQFVNYMNEAPKTPGMETAALGAAGSTTAAKGHAKGYMSKLMKGYQGKTNTSATADSKVGGLNLAVAEACENGCVSPEEAEAISSINSTKIPCKSDPEVAGSWTDPEKLNGGDSGKCIDAKANSKAMKCLGAFIHLMSIADDMHRGDKGSPADVIKVSLDKTKAANYVQCKVAKMMDNICLPESAGDDKEEAKAREELAKKYGVDCIKEGSRPSPACARQIRMAILQQGMGDTARQQNTPGSQRMAGMMSLMIAAMGLQNEGERAAETDNGGCGSVSVDVTDSITSFLNSPDIKTYMASAEFAKNVKLEMAWLPTMYGEIQYAMDQWTNQYDLNNKYVSLVDVWKKDFLEDQEIQLAQERRLQQQHKLGLLSAIQPVTRSCPVKALASLGQNGQTQAMPISAMYGQQ